MYFKIIKLAKQAKASTDIYICVSLPDRKANEGLLALSQEESMPISIRQLAYGTVDIMHDVISYEQATLLAASRH